MPAVLGFVVLVDPLHGATPDTFATKLNWANLVNQSAAVVFIAMGLVFVLLLGEIDLSAGYTAGVSAPCWRSFSPSRIGWPIACSPLLLVGTPIGLMIGLLVAGLGIPSFVVTLAASSPCRACCWR